MRFEIKTKFNKDLIDQSVSMANERGEITKEFARQVLKLQDEGVKEALVKLGWTPPKQEVK